MTTNEYKLSYTAQEIDKKLGKVDKLSEEIDDLSVFVTPQMFGAKGDGNTDDTLAFQSAIDNEKGLPVFIPNGLYIISQIILKDNLQLKGMSQENVVLKSNSDKTLIYGGDYDNNATGEDNPDVIGLKHCELIGFTVDGNKTAKNGIAIYGVNNVMKDITAKNCSGIGIVTESPGGIYSTDYNLQYTMMNITAFDNGIGNIYYNGQSDSNIFNVLCYRPDSTLEDSFNFKLGSKANGCRIFGLHVWGTSDYGIYNEGLRAYYTNCHAETGEIAQVYSNKPFAFDGNVYLNNIDNESVGFLLDNAHSSYINARCNRIKTQIKYVGSCSRNNITLMCHNGTNAEAKIIDGEFSETDTVNITLWGVVTDTIVQFPTFKSCNDITEFYSAKTTKFYNEGSGTPLFALEGQDNGVNYISIMNQPAGTIGGKIVARGSSGNLDIQFVPKGEGKVRFGDYVEQGSMVQRGYMIVKDSNGIERKLAVVFDS